MPPAGAGRPVPTIHQLVELRAEQQPDAIAVRDRSGALSYRRLVADARSVAVALGRDGVGEGDLVGIVASRDRRTLVALLGVAMSGAAYVPLEPVLPEARLRAIVDEARLAVCLVPDPDDAGPDLGVRRVSVDQLSAGGRSAPRAGTPAEDDPLAYVIFTSGSTGRPKGVLVTHSGVLNLIAHMMQEPGLRAGEVMLGVTTPAFDLSVPDLFMPLISGATLVLAARDECVDGMALRALVETTRPHLMQATPSTWRLLLAAGWPGQSGMRIVCGGEGYEAALGRDLAARVGEVWNFYGPTETTVWSVAQRLASDVTDPIPMGFPIAATRCRVLREDGFPAEAGETGELYIGGAGVARGYLGRADLTASVFVPDPDGGRAFRTGDFVRADPAGRLTFVERRDAQVKVRGYRVELGDIEAAVRSCPGVAQAAAVYLPEPVQSIVAFVILDQQPGADPGSVLEATKRLLPAYMVPTQVLTLDSFPLTPNGKVDRGALAGEAALRTPEPQAVPPLNGTPIEQAVAEVWREVLGGAVRELDDDFFSLGGDSLAATRIVARLSHEFGISLGVAALFEAPTVARLAVAVMGRLLEDADDLERLLDAEAQPDLGASP